MIGGIGAFSLGGKTLTTDRGGMIITNNEALARRAMGFSRKGSEMDSALHSYPSTIPPPLPRLGELLLSSPCLVFQSLGPSSTAAPVIVTRSM